MSGINIVMMNRESECETNLVAVWAIGMEGVYQVSWCINNKLLEVEHSYR